MFRHSFQVSRTTLTTSMRRGIMSTTTTPSHMTRLILPTMTALHVDRPSWRRFHSNTTSCHLQRGMASSVAFNHQQHHLEQHHHLENPLTQQQHHPPPSSIPNNHLKSYNNNNNDESVVSQSNLEKQINPVPDFSHARSAYEHKSTKELLRAALSFQLCRIPWLVQHSESMLRMGRRVLGDTITDALLKATLYGHFCAGEDERRIQPVVQAMRRAGIGSILDYAAEDDGESQSQQPQQPPASSGSGSGGATKKKHKSKIEELAEVVLQANHPNVRVYPFTHEDACDRHAETFQRSIRDVAKLDDGSGTGYTAMKVSALVDPKLLARLSRCVIELQRLFVKFDTDGNGYVSRDEFASGVETFFREGPDTRMRTILQDYSTMIDLEKMGGMIDYITWSLLIRPEDLPHITAGCRTVGPLALATPSEEELAMLHRLYQRIQRVAQEAADHNVRLLVDAEQTLYQPAIDSLVLDLQRQFNDPQQVSIPIIYNTYQSYLKDASIRLRRDVERAQRLGYHFGAKIVRGAYMESERELAATIGYPSPIHDTIEDTHVCYNQNIRYLLEQSQASPSTTKIEVMLASHNQHSIEQAVAVMNELGIDRRDDTICFAQLFGMMDHVTYALGKNEYRAYKYVPYGEVKMAMPYLVRRAKENSSISGGAARELALIQSELGRRVWG